MVSLFTRLSAAWKRWIRSRSPEVSLQDLTLIEPVSVPVEASAESENHAPVQKRAADQVIILPPLDGPNLWAGIDTVSSAATADPELAVATGQINEAAAVTSVAPDQPTDLTATTSISSVFSSESPIQSDSEEAVSLGMVLDPVAVSSSENMSNPLEAAPDQPSVTFTQIYDMITTEVGRRADSTIAAYERILGASRQELELTRRSSRAGWSVAGVLAAIAALGAVWSTGEVSSMRVETTALKKEVIMANQAVVERNLLRDELTKTREVSAKAQIDALRARLDQAMATSAMRDQQRRDLANETTNPAAAETNASHSAAAHPLSDSQPARPLSSLDRKATEPQPLGSQRQDAWSVLLNGRE